MASEVRALAGRSAEKAAKEIKVLIGASVEQVAQGTTLVDQAGTTMTEVVTSIQRVTDIMGQISAASNEQSLGVAQIGEAVTQMDQVTQQNAALVEQMAAAAGSLKSQAQELVQTVAVFKLGAGNPRNPAALPTAQVRAHPPQGPQPTSRAMIVALAVCQRALQHAATQPGSASWQPRRFSCVRPQTRQRRGLGDILSLLQVHSMTMRTAVAALAPRLPQAAGLPS